MRDTFGTLIRQARRATRLRAKDIASASGISASYYSLVEHGRIYPPPSLRSKIIEAFSKYGVKLSPSLQVEEVTFVEPKKLAFCHIDLTAHARPIIIDHALTEDAYAQAVHAGKAVITLTHIGDKQFTAEVK